MIALSIMVLLSAVVFGLVSWIGLADLVGEIPGAIIGFCCFFLPGVYFIYENLKRDPQRNDQEQKNKNERARH